jgi:predicted MFS family arabinose efflux permease
VASTVLRRTHPSQRGSAVGVLSAFYDLFVGISSFAAGAVAKRWGYPASFSMAAAAIGVAAIAGRFVFSRAEVEVERAEEVEAESAVL